MFKNLTHNQRTLAITGVLILVVAAVVLWGTREGRFIDRWLDGFIQEGVEGAGEAQERVEEEAETDSCFASMIALSESDCEVRQACHNGSDYGPDCEEWDGRANGMVSLIEPRGGTVTATFELWGPVGVWDTLEETHELAFPEDPGSYYNLQEIYYPDSGRELNDTLQSIEVSDQVVLCEHDTEPWGICLILEVAEQ